jgi:NADPH-dependent curcumin reductase CurA
MCVLTPDLPACKHTQIVSVQAAGGAVGHVSTQPQFQGTAEQCAFVHELDIKQI